MTATEILTKLSSLGCHSTDVTDALYEADPGRQVSAMPKSPDGSDTPAPWTLPKSNPATEADLDAYRTSLLALRHGPLD
jgi:hypothetical protein